MGLWSTSLRQRKIKRDRWVKRLRGLEGPWDGDARAWLEERQVRPPQGDGWPLGWYEEALGTIGGGNHFAELQEVHRVHDEQAAARLGLEADKLVLTVHSGSRGLGHAILRHHVDRHRAQGLPEDDPEAAQYMERHDYAADWARANRALIAHRFLEALGASGDALTDSCHNTLTRRQREGHSGWLHRKGAAPSDQGPQVIPGSRGALSYLVEPVDSGDRAAWSLAHGAGRKWSRGQARQKLGRTHRDALTQTELGSQVICEDKQLLYEEAPQAYKDIHRVIQDMEEEGLVRVIATLKPVITYKVRDTRS
jgi:release factor H-coupled RctB family protein